MTDITSVDLARRVGENLEQASPDMLRANRVMARAANAIVRWASMESRSRKPSPRSASK